MVERKRTAARRGGPPARFRILGPAFARAIAHRFGAAPRTEVARRLATYVGAALSSMRWGLAMLALFAIIYGVLYLILQAQDYALLAGALLSFVVLTLAMFATLRVDWSGASARKPQE